MRVHIGADHAGFELREALLAALSEAGYEMVDHGATTYDPADAYPPMCIACAEAVAAEPGSLGIVLGGSGNGEQMAANKVKGIRAALIWNQRTATLAREHNNANVCAVGAREHSIDEAIELVKTFLATGYDPASRHQSRIDMLASYEQTGTI